PTGLMPIAFKPINLMSLSLQSFNIILSLLDDRSLLRMREVCKSAKSSVDGFLVNLKMNRLTIIDEISFFGGAEGKTKITINSICPMNVFMWTICFNQISCNKIFPKFEIYFNGVVLSASLTTEEIYPVLDYLKPIIHTARFEKVHIFSALADVGHKCVALMEGSSAYHMNVTLQQFERINFAALLKSIQNVEVVSIKIVLYRFSPEEILFLILLADVVDIMTIVVSRQFASENRTRSLPLSHMIRMLKRKCHHLHFHDPWNVVSMEDVELMIQVKFNLIILSLTQSADVEHEYITIGSYQRNTAT
ncbi:hypothetical protein PENTCL1PPCAC_8419, partial [Pristionchus entomophagus]